MFRGKIYNCTSFPSTLPFTSKYISLRVHLELGSKCLSVAQRAISYGQVVSVSTVEAGLCLRPKYAISVYSSSSAIFRMYRKITNCGVYACTVTYIYTHICTYSLYRHPPTCTTFNYSSPLHFNCDLFACVSVI